MSILIKHVLNLSNIQAIRFRGLSFSSPIYNRQLIAKPDWTMRSRREVFCNERNSHRTRFITPRAKNHSLRLCTYTHSNTCKACHVIVLLHFTRGSLSCHHVEVYGRRRGRQGNGNRRRQSRIPDPIKLGGELRALQLVLVFAFMSRGKVESRGRQGVPCCASWKPLLLNTARWHHEYLATIHWTHAGLDGVSE